MVLAFLLVWLTASLLLSIGIAPTLGPLVSQSSFVTWDSASLYRGFATHQASAESLAWSIPLRLAVGVVSFCAQSISYFELSTLAAFQNFSDPRFLYLC